MIVPGLWHVRMWGYYWEYTSAQIELGLVDCPIVTYPRRKKKKQKGEMPEFGKADAASVNKAAEKWKKKYGDKAKGEGVRISLAGLKMFKKDNGGEGNG